MVDGIQNQLVLSANDIKSQIESIYAEMKADDITVEELEQKKVIKIKNLETDYERLFEMGEFKDEETGRIKSQNEICRTILEEMDRRDFSNWTKHQVWVTLKDSHKRAWRKPVDGTYDPNTGKLTKVSLLDPETDVLYNKYMDHINELFEFDYNDLPKSLQISIGEHFFKCYKVHNDAWLKQGITLVKHEQDTHDASKGDPIRIETRKKRKGELYHSMEELRDVITECLPIIESHPPEDLDNEHKYANAVRGLTAYFIPWKNSKWKKDWMNWIEIHIKQVELRSKSGAAKFSKIHVTSVEEGIDAWQGITREEIDKNRRRILRFARDFTKNFPYLAELSEYFMSEIEPVRAIHTVKLHSKMSEAAFT